MARERIRELLEDYSEFEIVGECGDGQAAVESIRDSKPDLVFLDVQMPVMDGCEVLRRVEATSMPLVVFVTAYDEHAIEAFELSALDYLLKPFDRPRFEQALERVRSQLASRDTDEVRRQLDSLWRLFSEPYLERLVVKSAGRISFVRVEEIEWIEAQGNYFRVHSPRPSALIRGSLNRLMTRLDPARFFRIHRSFVVNIDRVKELQPLFHGEYRVVLESGRELTSNRSFGQELRRLFP